MEVEDAFGLEKIEEVLADENAKRGEDTVKVRISLLELGDFSEVFGCTSVEDNVDMILENIKGGVS